MANVAIGKQIQAVVKKRGMKLEELAKLLNVSKPNMYDIYRRNSIDTGLLERLCKVLDHNFFEQYANKHRTQHERDSYKFVVRENSLLKQMVRDKDELYQMTKTQLELVRK
jgi:transcriptional regulator with XRE-family HTH domain